MTSLLFILLCISPLVQGTSTNSTSSSCHPSGVQGDTRSVWSILGTCGLTLFICVWHTIHPDVPSDQNQYKPFYVRVPWIFFTSFIAPEALVSYASKEWCEVRRTVKQFRVEGYELSMTHSHFVEMGGFVYHGGKGGRTRERLSSREFLLLCEKGEIANPRITEREINDKSKSDARGKAIFGLQLFWFTLQVIVRGSTGLAITLIELDTVCMSVLALLYLLFWWDKPLRPECPHVFYRSQDPGSRIYSPEELSKAWKAEPNYLEQLIAYVRKQLPWVTGKEEPKTFHCPKPGGLEAMIEDVNPVNVQLGALYLTWIILGGLHLVAWNWDFPTMEERIIWRVASIILAISPLAMTIIAWSERFGVSSDNITYVLGSLGVLSRLLLVGLMLSSLRALPCTAYETIPWMTYFPHL